MLRSIALCLFLILLGTHGAFAEASVISSRLTRVIDGGAFDLETGQRIRLQGISAPERHDPGGAQATAAMRALVEKRRVTCLDSGDRSYKRVVARCFLGETDVAAWLIARGLARDCPRFSGGRYQPLETANSLSLPLPRYCEPR